MGGGRWRWTEVHLPRLTRLAGENRSVPDDAFCLTRPPPSLLSRQERERAFVCARVCMCVSERVRAWASLLLWTPRPKPSVSHTAHCTLQPSTPNAQRLVQHRAQLERRVLARTRLLATIGVRFPTDGEARKESLKSDGGAGAGERGGERGVSVRSMRVWLKVSRRSHA